MHHIFPTAPAKKQPNIDEIIAGLVSRAVEGQTTQIDQSCLKHILTFQKTPKHSYKIIAAIMNEIDHKGEKSIIALKCLSLLYSCISSSENFVLAAKKFIPEMETICLLAYPSKDRYQSQLHTIARQLYFFLLNKAELPNSIDIQKVVSQKVGKSTKSSQKVSKTQERIPAAFSTTVQDNSNEAKTPAEIETLLSFNHNDTFRNDDLFSPMAPFTPKTQSDDLLSADFGAPPISDANFISFDVVSNDNPPQQKSNEPTLFDFDDTKADGFIQIESNDNDNSGDDDLLGEFGGPEASNASESEHSRSRDIFNALDAREKEEEQNLLDTDEFVEVKPLSNIHEVNEHQIQNESIDLFSPTDIASSNIVKNGASSDEMFNPFEPKTFRTDENESLLESLSTDNRYNENLLNDDNEGLINSNDNSFDLFGESQQSKSQQLNSTHPFELNSTQQGSSEQFDLFESNSQKQGSSEPFNPFESNSQKQQGSSEQFDLFESNSQKQQGSSEQFNPFESNSQKQGSNEQFDLFDNLNSVNQGSQNDLLDVINNKSSDVTHSSDMAHCSFDLFASSESQKEKNAELFDNFNESNDVQKKKSANAAPNVFDVLDSVDSSNQQISLNSPKSSEFGLFDNITNTPNSKSSNQKSSQSEKKTNSIQPFNPFDDFTSSQQLQNVAKQPQSQPFNPFDDFSAQQQPKKVNQQPQSQSFNPFDDFSTQQQTQQVKPNANNQQETQLFNPFDDDFSAPQKPQKVVSQPQKANKQPENPSFNPFDDFSTAPQPQRVDKQPQQVNKQPDSQSFDPFDDFSAPQQPQKVINQSQKANKQPQNQSFNPFDDFTTQQQPQKVINQPKTGDFDLFDQFTSSQQQQAVNKSKSDEFDLFDDLSSSQKNSPKNDQFDMLNGFAQQSSSTIQLKQETDLFGSFSQPQKPKNQKSLPGNTTDLFDSLSAPINRQNKQQPQSQNTFDPFMDFSQSNNVKKPVVEPTPNSNLFDDFSNFVSPSQPAQKPKKDDFLDLF